MNSTRRFVNGLESEFPQGLINEFGQFCRFFFGQLFAQHETTSQVGELQRVSAHDPKTLVQVLNEIRWIAANDLHLFDVLFDEESRSPQVAKRIFHRHAFGGDPHHFPSNAAPQNHFQDTKREKGPKGHENQEKTSITSCRACHFDGHGNTNSQPSEQPSFQHQPLLAWDFLIDDNGQRRFMPSVGDAFTEGLDGAVFHEFTGSRCSVHWWYSAS